MIAMLDAWENPVYLTRVWTIFEQHIALKLDIPVEVILPQAASSSLLFEIERGLPGIERVKASLLDVDSRHAKAWSPIDEAKVKDLIVCSTGFDSVDFNVKRCMTRWIGRVVESYMEHLVITESCEMEYQMELNKDAPKALSRARSLVP